MSNEPLPSCALALTPETLSAWRDHALPEAEAARVTAHIPTCAACQARLADYEQLARGLVAIHVPDPVGGYGRNPRMRIANAAGNRGRGPKLWGGLGALAAVVLIALAFTQVFHAFGQHPATSTSATATPTPTPTNIPITPPIPTCQTSQLNFNVVDVFYDRGTLKYWLAVMNTGNAMCTMHGFPSIHLNGASGPLDVSIARTAEAPQQATLGPAGSTPGSLYLSWAAAAPPPGASCTNAQSLTITTPNSTTSQSVALPLRFCGALTVSPMVPPYSDNGPLPQIPTTEGLATCTAGQLLLTLVQTDSALGHAGAMYVLTNTNPSSSCALGSYPALRLLDAQGQPLAVTQIDTTRAFTFQTDAPSPAPLYIGQSVYFYVDYAHAPQSDAACVTGATTLAVTPPGSAASVTTSDAFEPCGPIYVSPLQNFLPYLYMGL